MTLVNLTAVLSPANAARLADGTAQMGGVVLQDVATKRVLQWAPAVQQAGASLCARLGPYGIAAAAAGAAAVVVGTSVLAWRSNRKQRRKMAELAAQNAALAAENAKLRAGSPVPQGAPAQAQGRKQRVTNDPILAEAFDLDDLNDITTSSPPGTVPIPQRADGAA
jgi:hypothetical protein